MNNQEYWSGGRYICNTAYYKYVHRLLETWKIENNITECCVVHHRDDNEEVRAYNNEHYERWGFNEDGTFEYGKYVIFMTNAKHVGYHNKSRKVSQETREKHRARWLGEKNPHYGKPLPEEIKAKISNTLKGKMPWMYGKHHSIETKSKISNALKGKPLSDECRAKMSAARKRNLIGLRLLYNVYKSNNGVKKWNDFQKAIYNGDITFEERPISIFL